ncbi:MAG: hypothetical protein R6U65_05515 [Perlabentimonas sp.]
MERAIIVNKIINVFNEKQKQAEYLFSAESIVPSAGVMIEEFFEAKLNPFLRDLKQEISGLPPDDYCIIEIDSWVKTLNQQLTSINEDDIGKEFAESVYIKRKYIPKLITYLKDIKLELIEKLFDIPTDNVKTSNETVIINKVNSILSAGSIAELVAQLCNFNVISGDVEPDDLSEVFARLTGCSAPEIRRRLKYNSKNHRLETEISLEEMLALRKVIKSISARLENDIQIKSNEAD